MQNGVDASQAAADKIAVDNGTHVMCVRRLEHVHADGLVAASEECTHQPLSEMSPAARHQNSHPGIVSNELHADSYSLFAVTRTAGLPSA